MTTLVRNEELRYRNEAFAIHHLIDDCPPFTVVRELLKNAIENAALLTPPGRVEWFTEKVNGVPKIGLRNEGPGMSGDELAELMDLASTAKRLGTDANYGQGAKVSGLKVSPYGMVYRSCKAGRVSQIVLAGEQRPDCDFPVYVKKRQRVRDDQGDTWESVVDVTDDYSHSPDALLRDWTEVLLMGKNADHNTFVELIPTLKAVNWLIRLINCRFYRLPPGIVVSRANITTKQAEKWPRNAEGLGPLTLHWSERHEDVEVEHPKYGVVVVRYCKLKGSWQEDKMGNSRAKTMEAYGAGSRGDHVCLVWRDECYDTTPGWSRISGPFGITFGSANIAVQILLPEGAPVKNNTYRDAIIDRTGNHQPITVEDFADVVRASRPQWIIDYVEEQGRKSCDSGNDVRERLQAFLDFLKIQAQARPAVKDRGEDDGEVDNHDQGDGDENDENADEHSGRERGHKSGVGKRQPSRVVGIPDVRFTTDPGLLEQMIGRAACYSYKDGGSVVFLNPEHWKYLADLDALYDQVGPDEDRRQLAKKVFDEEYKFNAGRYIIISWIFRGKPEWTEKDWESALNKEALTCYLCSPDLLGIAQQKINQRLNTRKMEALDGD